MRRVEEQALAHRSGADRNAAFVAGFCGSMPFVWPNSWQMFRKRQRVDSIGGIPLGGTGGSEKMAKAWGRSVIGNGSVNRSSFRNAKGSDSRPKQAR